MNAAGSSTYIGPAPSGQLVRVKTQDMLDAMGSRHP
jgi:hypothetical protein